MKLLSIQNTLTETELSDLCGKLIVV